MLTERSARLLNLSDYGLAVGNPADIVVIDAATPEQAIAEVRQPLAVYKRDAVRWSDHFDFAGGASPQPADEIVALIIRPLVLVLEQEEASRAAAKEPAAQTADDLVWRGVA